MTQHILETFQSLASSHEDETIKEALSDLSKDYPKLQQMFQIVTWANEVLKKRKEQLKDIPSLDPYSEVNKKYPYCDDLYIEANRLYSSVDENFRNFHELTSNFVNIIDEKRKNGTDGLYLVGKEFISKLEIICKLQKTLKKILQSCLTNIKKADNLWFDRLDFTFSCRY